MDAVLADEAMLAKSELRSLYQRSDAPSLRRLALQLSFYLSSAAVLVLVDHPAAIAACLVLNGIAQFAFFGLLHEACHRTAFTRVWLNDLAGWIAALAQPMSPALMRAFHFAHHRHTHELERDPELAGLEFMARWPRGLVGLFSFTGIPLIVARGGWALFAALVPAAFDSAWTSVLPFVSPERRARVAWEARALVLVHAGLITLAATIYPPLGRVYAAMMLGHMLLSWYITCEHRGLPCEGSILARTRSIRVPAAVRWLLWNMPYHAEHHGWPAVPWHALPALHKRVEPHLEHHVRMRELYFPRAPR